MDYRIERFLKKTKPYYDSVNGVYHINITASLAFNQELCDLPVERFKCLIHEQLKGTQKSVAKLLLDTESLL